MNKKKYLFLSVKPEYAKKIVSGEKKFELRRTQPKLIAGDLIIIYATSPLKQVIGVCTVKSLLIDTPELVWTKAGHSSCIEKKDFDNYYLGAKFAVGIEIEQPYELISSLTLSDLRSKCSKFSVPQSYRYIDSFELKLQKYLRHNISNIGTL